MLPLFGLLLSGALAAPPRLDAILARPDPEFAVEQLEPALLTVLRQGPDGRVQRSGGLWLEPAEGLVAVALDGVDHAQGLAVQDASGVYGARLVAANPLLRIAVLQVSGLRPALKRPKIVLRYPRDGEPLPLLLAGSPPSTVTVRSSLETWVEVEAPSLPVGAVLLDSRGGAVGIAVPATGKRGPGVVPLVHAEPLVKLARAKGSWTRTAGPGKAQEACLAWARQGASTARGCVDPTSLAPTVTEAVEGAEAVLSAIAGEAVILNKSGWSEELASLLEGRGAVGGVAWAEGATPEAVTRGSTPEYHDLLYERGGMLADRRRPLESMQEAFTTGVRVLEVVEDTETSAWVRISGRNLDGSSWTLARHWTSFAGSWALDLDLDTEELAARPSAWPTALDEGDWLRDLLMARIIKSWKAEQAAQAERAQPVDPPAGDPP